LRLAIDIEVVCGAQVDRQVQIFPAGYEMKILAGFMVGVRGDDRGCDAGMQESQ
jgi:hypothetical protein